MNPAPKRKRRRKKGQADETTWPFWLKLSADGQADGYFE
jgi:mannose/cellobiose epimerase-like protein (N-acyl-D-glucosamine 2-epimerase family)